MLAVDRPSHCRQMWVWHPLTCQPLWQIWPTFPSWRRIHTPLLSLGPSWVLPLHRRTSDDRFSFCTHTKPPIPLTPFWWGRACSSHMTQPSLLASSKNTTNASHKKMPPTSWWEGDLEKPGHSNCNQVFILFWRPLELGSDLEVIYEGTDTFSLKPLRALGQVSSRSIWLGGCRTILAWLLWYPFQVPQTQESEVAKAASTLHRRGGQCLVP